MQERLQGALGAVVLLGIAFALCPSERRAHVSRRTLGYGLLLLDRRGRAGAENPAARAVRMGERRGQ